jgi:hypothetical protein
VRGNHDMRVERCTGPVTEDIASLVAPDVPETCLLEQTLHFLATRGFQKTWRGDFREPDLRVNRLRLATLRRRERGLDSRLQCQREYGAVR